jgi:hypothetical protein
MRYNIRKVVNSRPFFMIFNRLKTVEYSDLMQNVSAFINDVAIVNESKDT